MTGSVQCMGTSRVSNYQGSIVVRAVHCASRNGEDLMHPRLQVLGDVTVQHPAAGVAHLDEEIGGPADRQEEGVLPDEILARNTVLRQHQEALAVNVDRVLHRME